MILKNTVYMIKCDEGKYIIVHSELSGLSPTNIPLMPDVEDNPLQYYHLDGNIIATQLFDYPIQHGYKIIIKVFNNYQTVLEYLSSIGIMQ